jgi:hypothetical protein
LGPRYGDGSLDVPPQDETGDSVGSSRQPDWSCATTGSPLPGSGSVEVQMNIPGDLDNLEFFSQFLFYDPGAKGGVSATEGLDSTICCGC